MKENRLAIWTCECLKPEVQIGETVPVEEIDYNDVSWHQLGCHVRLNAAAMAMVNKLFDIESLHPEPRVLRNGINERQAEDLYLMARWFAHVAEVYRTKEAHYGRTWAEMGWLGQVVQIYRRARRLMVMGWWHYDEVEFDEGSAMQNAEDLVAHSYFFTRLLNDRNRKGHVR